MSEMVERVAKALLDSKNEGWLYAHDGTPIMQLRLWSWNNERHRRNFIAHSRSAIAAMREQTEEMLNAGVRVMVDWDSDCDGRIPEDIFRAMIDAALK